MLHPHLQPLAPFCTLKCLPKLPETLLLGASRASLKVDSGLLPASLCFPCILEQELVSVEGDDRAGQPDAVVHGPRSWLPVSPKTSLNNSSKAAELVLSGKQPHKAGPCVPPQLPHDCQASAGQGTAWILEYNSGWVAVQAGNSSAKGRKLSPSLKSPCP